MNARATRMRPALVMAALVLGLGAAMAAGVAFGAVPVPLRDLAGALLRGLTGAGMSGVSDTIVLDVRLPRVVLAALVGASLAGAGVLYQALFRNPLADPYILGVSSGAGLGATIAVVLTSGATALRFGLVPAAAFVGAILTMLAVVRLASARGRLDSTSLLLAGVAVSYTLAAVQSFLLVFAREQMTVVVYWLMGGFTAASWAYVFVVGSMFLIGIAAPMASRRQLNLLLLGDERASELGLGVDRFRYVVLGAASLLTAGAVAVAGLIGFVGLMTPHMVRLVLGPDHRLLLPASLLTGGIVLVVADLIARTVLAPVEIPVGIVTAVLGGPFFLYLLVRQERGR